MTASTASAFAISTMDLRLPLKTIDDVRETTLRRRICASWPIKASVAPSARYSCVGSPDRFSRGRTAIDMISARPESTLLLRSIREPTAMIEQIVNAPPRIR